MLNWKRFVHRPTLQLPKCHAATVVQLPDDSLMCAYYAGAHAKARDVAIYGATLAPDAEEWESQGVFADTPGFSEGNPVLDVDPEQKLWLYYVTMLGDRWDTCQIKYSHYNSVGWKPPMYLHHDWGWMTGCKPIHLADGTILLPLYEESGSAFVLISSDGGRTWESSNFITTDAGVIQPTIAPLADGTLLMFLRTREPQDGTVWQSCSSDQGRTWSEPKRTSLYNPDARIDLTRLASGRLALAFNDAAASRSPLTIALSEDEGATFPIRYDVETDAAEFSYPTLIQARDGLLHLVYTYRRTHIAHVAVDEAWIIENARPVRDVPTIW
jgi:predicted neuraminidase